MVILHFEPDGVHLNHEVDIPHAVRLFQRVIKSVV